jgi:molybdenum cofactor cytidylyltransferase
MADNPVYAVVLAAGTGSRFGSTKQLAPVDGRPMVERAVRAAESVCGTRSLLVVGKDWREVAAAAAPLAGFLVLNPEFRAGLSTSIRSGVAGIRGVADAVLLMLADQPLVDATHLQALIDKWRESPTSIVASRYAGTCGPPAIFPADLFTALQSLTGDRGARPVIEANRARVREIDCAAAARDIDRPTDLAQL